MNFVYFVVAILIAISIHESAHAWVANYLGDPTAKDRGRVTLNPLKHLDAMGVLMLVIVGIGWGKPVPVNPRNFKNPVRGSAITSLAGPMSNFLTAILLAVPLKYFGDSMPVILFGFLVAVFDFSILLGVFNLLPFPPLDGSKILGLIMPKKWYPIYAQFLDSGLKYFVVFLIIDTFVLRRMFNFSILGLTIGTIFSFVRSVILIGS